MRARLVRPAFWTDSRVARLAPATRLFYIGLWCIADDAGYFEWDIDEICAAVAPYAPSPEREEQARQAAAELEEIGRIKILDCGEHAWIPTLERHRIAGGNKSTTIKAKHESERKSGPVRTSTDKSRSESPSESPSESESKRARGRRPEPAKGSAAPPMNTERAEAIMADPASTTEAVAGARSYLELAGRWLRRDRGALRVDRGRPAGAGDLIG